MLQTKTITYVKMIQIIHLVCVNVSSCSRVVVRILDKTKLDILCMIYLEPGWEVNNFQRQTLLCFNSSAEHVNVS